MSCPNWKGLTAWRRERDGVEPAGYREALAHLDAGCTLCRRQALAADPTLMFRAVPVMEIPEAHEVDEVEAMRQAVAAMRTASRMEALETRRTRQGWWKWASAAMLAVAALSVSTDGRFGAEQEPLRAGSRRTDSVMNAGTPAVLIDSTYDAELLPAGSGADGSLGTFELGGGLRPITVGYDPTLPEGFFEDI